MSSQARCSSYAVLVPPRVIDLSAGPGYVAARLNELGLKWRWVTHPMAVNSDETLCVSLVYNENPELSQAFCGKRILVGGIGVAWGGRISAPCPVTHFIGHVERLCIEHLEADSELVDLGWDYDSTLVPIFPKGGINWTTKYVILSTGHGCHYGRCRFCSAYISGQKLYERAPLVMAEVAGRVTANYDGRLGTRTSQDGPSSGWIDDFATAIIKHKQTKDWMIPRWTTYLRADQVTAERARLLHQANCIWVSVGAEYLCDSVLGRLNKGVTVSDIMKAHGILVEIGINPLLTFIDLDEVVTPFERKEHYANLEWLKLCCNGREVAQDSSLGWPTGTSDWNGTALNDSVLTNWSEIPNDWCGR